jgi:polyisoprenoid-binding protein YceI
MFKRLLLATALFAASATSAAAGVAYTLDPTHTNVLASWSHFGFSNPFAHFGDVDGTLVYDEADVSRSSVQVTLPLSGLNAFSAKFDEHLRSADFFDAARFPHARFASTRVEAAGPGKLKITGNLTIRDVTRPVVLDATLNKAAEHPMAKVPAIGFDATTTIKRSDFGVGAYAPMVGNEVTLRITTEATAARPAGK